MMDESTSAASTNLSPEKTAGISPSGNPEMSQRRPSMAPVPFFATWLVFVNLTMFKFYNMTDDLDLPFHFINSPIFATAMFFFWFVAPIVFLLGFRSRRVWFVVFFAGAAFVIQSYSTVSPYLDEAVDRDEATRLGIEQLIKGESPYLARTTKGLPLSPWPGALVIGMPSFFLSGRGDALNPAFFILLALIVSWRLKGSPWALCLSVLLMMSYTTLHGIVWGSSDFYLAAVFMALFVELASRRLLIPAGAALALALTIRTATGFILGAPLLILLMFGSFRKSEKSQTLGILLGFGMAVLLAGGIFLMDPSAMIESTLLPGNRKLGYESGNYLIWVFHFIRDTWRPVYPFLLLSLILSVQSLLIRRNQNMFGCLLAQVSGLLMMCFFYIPDWANPSKYLGLPVVLGIYAAAYGYSTRPKERTDSAVLSEPCKN